MRRSTTKQSILIDKIKQVVSKHYGIAIDDLVGISRKSEIAIPRHIAVSLCRAKGCKLAAVGQAFNRHHNTIINSCRITNDLIHTNTFIIGSKIKDDWEILQEAIKKD